MNVKYFLDGFHLKIKVLFICGASCYTAHQFLFSLILKYPQLIMAVLQLLHIFLYLFCNFQVETDSLSYWWLMLRCRWLHFWVYFMPCAGLCKNHCMICTDILFNRYFILSHIYCLSPSQSLLVINIFLK